MPDEMTGVIAIEGMPVAGDPFTMWARDAVQSLDKSHGVTVRQRDDGKLEAVYTGTLAGPPTGFSIGSKPTAVDGDVDLDALHAALTAAGCDLSDGWAVGITKLATQRDLCREEAVEALRMVGAFVHLSTPAMQDAAQALYQDEPGEMHTLVTLAAENDQLRQMVNRAREACRTEMEPWDADADDETVSDYAATAARIYGVLGGDNAAAQLDLPKRRTIELMEDCKYFMWDDGEVRHAMGNVAGLLRHVGIDPVAGGRYRFTVEELE